MQPFAVAQIAGFKGVNAFVGVVVFFFGDDFLVSLRQVAVAIATSANVGGFRS